MRPLSRWLPALAARFLALAALFLVRSPRRPLLPSSGWSTSFGYLSGPWPSGSLLGCCSAIDAPCGFRAPGHAALVPVPGRQCRTGPARSGACRAFRPQVPAGSAGFVSSSTQGGGLAHLPQRSRPRRDIACVLLWRRLLDVPRLPRYAYARCRRRSLAAHVGLQPASKAMPTEVAAVQPAAQTAGAQQWPAGGRRRGSPATIGHPAGRRRAQASSTFPERRCWPVEDARATS
ncbi:hypothetical protein ACHWUR_00450 [Klebsiella pneumoniae]